MADEVSLDQVAGKRFGSKRKGSKRELQAIQMLESLGFHCTKAGGSLGAWDIIAISGSQVWAIQVKSNRWPGQAELKRMFEMTMACRKVIFRFDDRKPVRLAGVYRDEGRVVVTEYTWADPELEMLRDAQKAVERARYQASKERSKS